MERVAISVIKAEDNCQCLAVCQQRDRILLTFQSVTR